jgi:hypothetical protein
MRFITVLLTLMVCSLASPSYSQTFRVVVTRETVSPCIGGVEYDSGNVPSGTNLSIPLSTCAKRINITASGSTVTIGRITLTNGPSLYNVDVIFGTATSINQQDVQGPAVGCDWAGLDNSGMGFPNRVRLSGTIGGNLTGSVRAGTSPPINSTAPTASPRTGPTTSDRSPTTS